jgi:hypothetical protein
MEKRRMQETDEETIKPLRRGWCLGGDEFRKKMLDLLEGDHGENHSGEIRQETAEVKAKRILAEELGRRGWDEEELARRRKNDHEKLAIAARLRKETTLTIKGIASMVSLGTSRGANATLHKWMQQADKPPGSPATVKERKQFCG